MFNSLSTEYKSSLLCFQSRLFPSPHLSLPLLEQPICGYSSTPTPSMGMDPLWPARLSTAQPVGAGMIGSQWIPRVTRLGTLTQIQSMRLVCFSPDQEKAALDLLGQLWEQEQNVPVSTTRHSFDGRGLSWCLLFVLHPTVGAQAFYSSAFALHVRIKILLKVNSRLNGTLEPMTSRPALSQLASTAFPIPNL